MNSKILPHLLFWPGALMVAFGGAINPGVQIAGVMMATAAVYFERTDLDDIARQEAER